MPGVEARGARRETRQEIFFGRILFSGHCLFCYFRLLSEPFKRSQLEAATTIQTLLFWTFSVIGLAGAVGLLFNKNPVYAALSLVLNFFSIAGLYLSLGAEFLAAVQILVYAGAIMVLFLFVIMLLNLREEEDANKFDIKKGAAFILGLGFLAEMIFVSKDFMSSEAGGTFDYGKVEPVGRSLMTEYLFPFEMISVVLLAALIGAILVARRYTHTEG